MRPPRIFTENSAGRALRAHVPVFIARAYSTASGSCLPSATATVAVVCACATPYTDANVGAGDACPCFTRRDPSSMTACCVGPVAPQCAEPRDRS